MAKRITLEAVNNELARRGHAERLVKADNYFLFSAGAADEWINRAVGVRTISSMTLKQWIAEFERLKALNEQIMGTVKKEAKSGRARK